MSLRVQTQLDPTELKHYHKMFLDYRRRIESSDRFLTAIMEGRLCPVPGEEHYAQFFIDVLGGFNVEKKYVKVFWLYLQLRFGDPQIPRLIPTILAYKHFPELQEAAFMQLRKKVREKAYQDSLTDPYYQGLRIAIPTQRLR